MYEVTVTLRSSKSFPEQDLSEFCESTFWLVSPAPADSFPPFSHSPRVALALYPVLFSPGKLVPACCCTFLYRDRGGFRGAPQQACGRVAGLSKAHASLTDRARSIQSSCSRRQHFISQSA